MTELRRWPKSMSRRPKYSEEDFPAPGTIFVAPTQDGRLSCGRVLRRQYQGGAQAALVAASPWIGSELPPIELPRLRETLVLSHHHWKNRQQIFWVWDRMPPSFTIIGQIELSPDDQEASSTSFTGWETVPLQALLQWRWDHDREALLREEARQSLRKAESCQRAAEARARLLQTLTLDSLVARTWFPSWDADDSSVPLLEARSLMYGLVHDLRSAPKLAQGLARRLLKRSVEGFNRLDAAHQFINTLEREEICEAYEEIMRAARFPQLVDAVDQWRDW